MRKKKSTRNYMIVIIEKENYKQKRWLENENLTRTNKNTIRGRYIFEYQA